MAFQKDTCSDETSATRKSSPKRSSRAPRTSRRQPVKTLARQRWVRSTTASRSRCAVFFDDFRQREVRVGGSLWELRLGKALPQSSPKRYEKNAPPAPDRICDANPLEDEYVGFAGLVYWISPSSISSGFPYFSHPPYETIAVWIVNDSPPPTPRSRPPPSNRRRTPAPRERPFRGLFFPSHVASPSLSPSTFPSAKRGSAAVLIRPRHALPNGAVTRCDAASSSPGISWKGVMRLAYPSVCVGYAGLWDVVLFEFRVAYTLPAHRRWGPLVSLSGVPIS